MPTPWIIIVALKELGIIPNDKKSGYETSVSFYLQLLFALILRKDHEKSLKCALESSK